MRKDCNDKTKNRAAVLTEMTKIVRQYSEVFFDEKKCSLGDFSNGEHIFINEMKKVVRQYNGLLFTIGSPAVGSPECLIIFSPGIVSFIKVNIGEPDNYDQQRDYLCVLRALSFPCVSISAISELHTHIKKLFLDNPEEYKNIPYEKKKG